MNNKSNEIWKNDSIHDNWELRRHRFTDEMRPVIFHYLGIKPDSIVLDSGCGTGVFTRYIARGLRHGGKAKGFDISKYSVAYGNKKIAEENLSEVCELIEEDGFELPFEDNTYDAVTNYTYIDVLSDPVAGLKEMIRVCKPGGKVSHIIPIKNEVWKGEYPFDINGRLNELYNRKETLYRNKILNMAAAFHQSSEWSSQRYPKMFEMYGLKQIHIHSFSSAFSYSDGNWPLEYRRYQAEIGINNLIREITYEFNSYTEEFGNYGFSKLDFEELIELLKKKQKYLIENIESDKSFEMVANLNVIVTGVK